MTTARDVIAKNFTGPQVASFNAILDFLITNGPDSVRLELAALLNPWRPIETAPKEPPKDILVYCSTNTILVPGYVYVAAWHPRGWITWGDERLAFEPTHWLPLPAPPSEDK